jgi:hypothetical protein
MCILSFFTPMKLSTSNGAKVVINHPSLNVPVNKSPAYTKFSPDNHKLIFEKRQRKT